MFFAFRVFIFILVVRRHASDIQFIFLLAFRVVLYGLEATNWFSELSFPVLQMSVLHDIS